MARSLGIYAGSRALNMVAPACKLRALRAATERVNGYPRAHTCTRWGRAHGVRTKREHRTSVDSPISYMRSVLGTKCEFGEVRAATVDVTVSRIPTPCTSLSRTRCLITQRSDHMGFGKMRTSVGHWIILQYIILIRCVALADHSPSECCMPQRISFGETSCRLWRPGG